MRSVWRVFAIAGGAVAGWVVGCTRQYCYYGMFPFDGQTAVPLDTVITFDAGAVLPPDLPALEPGIRLQRVDGPAEDVAIAIAVDRQAGIVSVTPTAPLAPAATYRLSGIDAQAVATPHQPAPLWRESAEIEFQTGSDPKLLAVLRDTAEVVLLVLSEEIAIEVLEDELVLTDAEDVPVEGVVLGPLDGDPHVVAVQEDGTSVAAQFRTSSAAIYDDYDVQFVFDWYQSRPACGDEGLGGLR